MSFRRLAVIMAGGSGERFWPVSRQHRPKQLLKLSGETTMIDEAVERIAPLVGRENVLVATTETLRDAMHEALPSLPAENILAEPEKRNTAGCIAYVAAQAQRFGPDNEVTMGILTADHIIGQEEQFRATLNEAYAFAEREDALMTVGIRPSRPETGYGYIEAGDEFAATPVGPIRRVRQFHEKPNAETAEEYVAAGRYLWNSGMFFWRVATLMEAFEKHLPAHCRAIDRMREGLGAEEEGAVRAAFVQLPGISIDKGVMEKAKNVFTISGEFPWDDVGEWSALERYAGREAGNVLKGETLLLDSGECIVYNDTSAARKLTITGVGLENLVIVATDNAVLVVPKDRSQDVKKIVEEIRRQGRRDLL